MLVSKAKILRSKSPISWYTNRIGEEIYVFSLMYNQNFGVTGYLVIPAGTHEYRPLERYVDGDDIEILETFDANISETTVISIERK